MKSFSSRLIPVAIASILCGVALAGGGQQDDHTNVDKNGGKITAAQYADKAKATFEKMDTNHDGYVTEQEMDAYHAQMMGKHKGNSKEWSEGDTNAEKMADKKAYDPSGTGKSMPNQMSSAEKIATMDTNNDGKLSEDEFVNGAKQRFSKMDKNGDGALTAQEIRDGERAMMASDE